jgi:hypothetical protein
MKVTLIYPSITNEERYGMVMDVSALVGRNLGGSSVR